MTNTYIMLSGGSNTCQNDKNPLASLVERHSRNIILTTTKRQIIA